MKYLRSTLALFVLRCVWESWPGLLPCIAFWAYAKVGDPVFRPGLVLRRRVLHGIGFVGGALNAIATIANGGHMPALNKVASSTSSVWVPMTDASRFRVLCDIHGGASVGDFFIFVALAGFLLNWLLEKIEVLDLSTHHERMPGLGI